jgi:3-isopropylmalate/(R)-2-methylmalate dehydratase small subunit
MPEPLRRLTGIAASLPIENVDTDMIYPGSAGKSLKRGEQARVALHRLRFTPEGEERPDFVLNKMPWREARFLVAGDNFGCGSSREMAVWALHEWGLRCIIAPRFGDIFYNNCCLNGLLPVRLDRPVVDRLMVLAENPATATMTVDLERCVVEANGETYPFEIEARAREGLLEGLDAIGMTLSSADRIAAFGNRYRAILPWNAEPTRPLPTT